jgi:hypothetical protein
MARGDSLPTSGQAQAAQLSREVARIRETVEKLTGERGDATKTLSAVRRGELRALASLSLKSAQVTASPTAADFNALQTDVANISQALDRISNLLGNASIPKV